MHPPQPRRKSLAFPGPLFPIGQTPPRKATPEPHGSQAAEIRARQVSRIVLDSGNAMTSAHAIHRAAGFRTVAAPPDFPPERQSRVVFLQLDLA